MIAAENLEATRAGEGVGRQEVARVELEAPLPVAGRDVATGRGSEHPARVADQQSAGLARPLLTAVLEQLSSGLLVQADAAPLAAFAVTALPT